MGSLLVIGPWPLPLLAGATGLDALVDRIVAARQRGELTYSA